MKSLKGPVKVIIKSKVMQSFKEYLSNHQNDNDVKFGEISKELVLLPKYWDNLNHNEFSLPPILTPVFAEHAKTNDLRAYECEILTDLEDELRSNNESTKSISYNLECNFNQSFLENLASGKGESVDILKMIISELFSSKVFDSYSDNDSTIIINSGMTMWFTKKAFIDDVKKILSNHNESEDTVFHTDQLVLVWNKLLSLLKTKGEVESDHSKELDTFWYDEELKADPSDNFPFLQIRVMLVDAKNENKKYKYKVISSMDQIRIKSSIKITFKQLDNLPKTKNILLESQIFESLYTKEILKIKEFYQKSDFICDKNGNSGGKWDLKNDYMMLHGQKGTGKTFFILNIFPKIFRNWDIEYIDLNRMMLMSSNFSNMEATIKYLSSIFLSNYDSKLKKIYIIDHLDWALPKEDPNEMSSASQKIRQNQLLMFFTDLIDSKKYWLLFIGRHYQNIHSDLATIGRIDNFVQISPPDFKKRKIAFEEIIKSSYNPKSVFDKNLSEIEEKLNERLLNHYGIVLSYLN